MSQLDSFYTYSYLQIADNEIVNQKILDKLNTSIPREDDFPNSTAYNNFRFKHAIGQDDKESAITFFQNIIKLDSNFDVDNNDVIYLLDVFFVNDEYFKLMYNYVRKINIDNRFKNDIAKVRVCLKIKKSWKMGISC
ncbi:MAG: hypothetical protein R2795_26195 [Saprospiraceae bacterium]